MRGTCVPHCIVLHAAGWPTAQPASSPQSILGSKRRCLTAMITGRMASGSMGFQTRPATVQTVTGKTWMSYQTLERPSTWQKVAPLLQLGRQGGLLESRACFMGPSPARGDVCPMAPLLHGPASSSVCKCTWVPAPVMTNAFQHSQFTIVTMHFSANSGCFPNFLAHLACSTSLHTGLLHHVRAQLCKQW